MNVFFQHQRTDWITAGPSEKLTPLSFPQVKSYDLVRPRISVQDMKWINKKKREEQNSNSSFNSFNLKRSAYTKQSHSERENEPHKWLSFNSYSAHVSLTKLSGLNDLYVFPSSSLLLGGKRYSSSGGGIGKCIFINFHTAEAKYKHQAIHCYCRTHRTFNVISFTDKHVWGKCSRRKLIDRHFYGSGLPLSTKKIFKNHFAAGIR